MMPEWKHLPRASLKEFYPELRYEFLNKSEKCFGGE